MRIKSVFHCCTKKDKNVNIVELHKKEGIDIINM